MARFLAAAWSIPGHFYPNLAVAKALRDRGHEVAFFSGRRARRAVEAEGFRFLPFTPELDAHVERFFFAPRPAGPRWQPRMLALRRDYFDWIAGSLREQSSAVETALRDWPPDVLISDPALWGVFLVTPERHRLPTAIFGIVPFCPLPGPGIPPLGWGLPPGRTAWTRFRNRLAGALHLAGARRFRLEASRLRLANGLGPLAGSVTEASGKLPLYLVAGTREFDYGRQDLPPTVHYVGPCPWKRRRDPEQPKTGWLDRFDGSVHCVHVTEGTVSTGQPLLSRAAVAGLASLDVRVLLSTAEEKDHGLGPLPPNVVVEHWTRIHFEDLLPRLDLLVCTAGGGTVMSALEAGVPLVLVPGQWDKPEVAQRVAAAGAGLVIPPSRCTPRRLRAAVELVLSDRTFRDRAAGLAASFARYGGPAQAAELLEGLVPAGRYDAAAHGGEPSMASAARAW